LTEGSKKAILGAMLTIRLTRVGKKKQPSYRFIVSEKARDPWGKALELLGTYNPLTNPSTIKLEKERILYWISKGAQCSETVWNLFVDQGIVQGAKKRVNTIKKRHAERLAKKAA
jgi:small subunit ribosomal protein S16